MTVPKNKEMAVHCGWLNKSVLSASHVVLVPNDEALWQAGLVIREQLIQLISEDNAKVKVTVENMTGNDITLCSCTTLSWLHSVDTIFTPQAKSMADQLPQSSAHSVSSLAQSSRTAPAEPWDPPVNLSLMNDQQQQVKQMLREECSVFCKR